MLKKENGEEITRTDLLFKADEDSDEIIDMDAEWADYRSERLREDLHDLALYLAKQARTYEKENPA